MTYTFACPDCGQGLRGERKRAGSSIICPSCGCEVHIPHPPYHEDAEQAPVAGPAPAASPAPGGDAQDPPKRPRSPRREGPSWRLNAFGLGAAVLVLALCVTGVLRRSTGVRSPGQADAPQVEEVLAPAEYMRPDAPSRHGLEVFSRRGSPPAAAASSGILPRPTSAEREAFLAIGLYDGERILSVGVLAGNSDRVGPSLERETGAVMPRPPSAPPPRNGFRGPLSVARLEAANRFLEQFPRSVLCDVVRQSLVADTTRLLRQPAPGADAAMLRALCLASLRAAWDGIGRDLWSNRAVQGAAAFLEALADRADSAPDLWRALIDYGLLDLFAAVIGEGGLSAAAEFDLCSRVLLRLPGGAMQDQVFGSLLQAYLRLWQQQDDPESRSSARARLVCGAAAAMLDAGWAARAGPAAAALYEVARVIHGVAPEEAESLMQGFSQALPSGILAEKAARMYRFWNRDAALRVSIALRLQAEAQFREQLPAVLAAIDPKEICAEEGLTYPVQAPRISRERLREELDKAVKEAVEREFPPSRLRDIQRTAKRTFSPWELGDEITVNLLPGRMGGRVTGRFHARYPSHVRIGERTLLLADIVPLDRIRLDPERCARQKETYIETRSAAFRKQRDIFRRRQEEELPQVIYAKAGYVLRGDGWRDPVAVFMEAMDRRRAAVRERLRAELIAARFTAAGFVLVDDEWVPADPDAPPAE